MSKTTMSKLSKKAIKLKLESLVYKIDKTNIVTSSIEDGFDSLETCIVCLLHDLESTKRERDDLIKRSGR